MPNKYMTHIYAAQGHEENLGKAFCCTLLGCQLEDHGELHEPRHLPYREAMEKAVSMRVTALVQIEGGYGYPGTTHVLIDGELATWGTSADGAPVVHPILCNHEGGSSLGIDLEESQKVELIRFMKMRREFWKRFHYPAGQDKRLASRVIGAS
jgi:hypothetical protein